MAEAKAWVMIPKPSKDGSGVVLEMRPLVLCKDCEHYETGFCNNRDVYPWPDDYFFCADGASRTEQEEPS